MKVMDRNRLALLFAALVVALTVIPTAAVGSTAAPTAAHLDTPTSDILVDDDMIVTTDFPRALNPWGQSETASYSDPSGLIDYFEFTSLYSLGTDRILVFTCDYSGSVGMTSAQATDIGNDAVHDHFWAMSEGRYNIEFIDGGHLAVGSGSSSKCDTAATNYVNNTYTGPDVNGVMFIADIGGGFAGPGSTCAVHGWCPPTYPSNGRSGFVTDGGVIAMVWSHEHGHMLTWPHSNSGTGSDYDNPMDLMSGNSSYHGGTNPSPYETIAPNRLAAGWIDQDDVVIWNGSDLDVDLGTAGASGKKMIAVEIDSDTFWSVGPRISDSNDPFHAAWSGVEVMIVENCGGCYPLSRGQFTAGAQAWTPRTTPIHTLQVGDSETLGTLGIQVVSADGDSVRVIISDPTEPPDYVKRLAGSDRYSTAAAVSAEAHPTPGAVDTVFIATGTNFPDALGAAAAAGHVGAPVLLVNSGVPGATSAELSRLDPTTIYVVGGQAVMSDAVVATLGAYGTVVRLSGSNRYNTAAAVSAEVYKTPSAVDTVFVATGSNFPDALGAAAAAGHLGAPVLLVGETVPGATASELTRLGPSKIYVVGGSAVISDAVAASLGAYGTVERLAGANRYATAAAVSQEVYLDPGAVDAAFVATGFNFPDALGAAAAAGHLGGPVLLVGDNVPGPTATELARLKPLTTVYVAGGVSVVSNFVAAAL